MWRWEQIWTSITEPRATDPDEARREYMTRVIATITGLTLLAFTVVILFGWAVGAFEVYGVLRILLFSAPVVAAWLLALLGHWRWAVYILPLVFLSQGLASTLEFGLATPTLFYAIAVLLTAILLGIRAQWLVVALCTIGYVVAGWLAGDKEWDYLVPQALVVGGSLIGIALLQWFSTSLLQRTLREARSYAKELRAYRSHLEDLVQERSAEVLQANEELQREIAEHKRTEEELAHSNAFIAALNRVAARIESTRDPDQVLTTLGNELQELGLTYGVSLWKMEAQALTVHYTSIESSALALAEKLAGFNVQGYHIPGETWLVREVVKAKRSVFAQDPIEMTASLVPQVPKAVIRQAARLIGVTDNTPAVYLPLAVEERVMGVLAVWGPDLQEGDVSALSIFAGQVAGAFENARLFQAEQQRTMELSTLLEATRAVSSTLDLEKTLVLIAKKMTKALGVDGCTISRWDREADAIVTWFERRLDREKTDEPGTAYALEDFPITRAVLETRQPTTVRVSDPNADPAEVAHMRRVGITNVLMLPLVASDRVIGLVELDESQGERAFSQAEIRLCQALADQAAVAIENARLYDSARRDLEERKRAEDALQKAHDELERRVRERTFELTVANAGLQAEILERQRAEDALRESEGRYRQLVEHAPAGIYELDMTEGRFTAVNDVMCEYTGYTHEEFLNLDPFDLLSEEGKRQFLERQVKVAAGEQVPETVEYKIKAKDGREFWVLLNSRFSLEGDGGKTTVVVHDITELKLATQALQESEEKYRRVVENANEAILVAQDGVLKFANPKTLDLSGYSRAELATMPFIDLIHPQDRAMVAGRHQQRLSGENPEDVYTFRIVDKSGKVRWVEIRVILIEWDDRPATLSFLSEITERVQAEDALRKSEALLHSLVDSLPQNIYSKDLEGRFTFANQRYCATEGKELDGILGQTDFELYPAELAEKYRKDDSWVVETEQIFETVEEHRPLGGELSFVQVIKTPLYDFGGRVSGTLGIFWDVTERRRVEQLLQALNQAALAMERVLTHEEIFAAAAGELEKIGYECMLLLADETQSRLSWGYGSFESRLIRAAEKMAGIRRGRFSFPVEQVDLYRRVVWDREVVLVEGDDVMRQVLPERAKELASQLVKMMGMSKSIAAPLIVEDVVVGVLSVHSEELLETDIPTVTAFAHQVAAAWRKAQLIEDLGRSLEELRQTQSQLVQAQKMEAIGRLAGGVAHDFNNLLTIVQVNTQLLMRQLHSQDPLWEHARQIQEAGGRAAMLTKQLLRFSRREIVEPQIVNINQLAIDLERMLRRVIGEDIELVVTLADNLWSVEVDPSQMEQVIVNLTLNARDAMPDGGLLSIATANVVLDGKTTVHSAEMQPGEYVMLTISDTGVGMDEEVQARLFEPFFTTKEQGQGTGLGLSTVYGIVTQNEGYVGVSSQVGQGTAFQIYLPRTVEVQAPRETSPPEAATGPIGGSQTIMVVEDEAHVRELAEYVLGLYGYQVLTAEDGPRALEVSREHSGPIHLLLTDVVMPGMTGRDLADQLQSQRPEMQVLYTSGYSDQMITPSHISGEEVAFLAKPFTVEELARKVQAVLNSPP